MKKFDSHKFYKSKAWQEKRDEIIERDHNECQHCKKKGKVFCGQMGILEVHHIQHLKKRKDLALVDSNLITLCSSCHNEEHEEKGFCRKKNENSKNFSKFSKKSKTENSQKIHKPRWR